MIDKTTIVSDSDTLTRSEAVAALDRGNGILKKTRRNLLPVNADDLIGSLSESYENRRARQVFEWEKTRRGRFAGF